MILAMAGSLARWRLCEALLGLSLRYNLLQTAESGGLPTPTFRAAAVALCAIVVFVRAFGLLSVVTLPALTIVLTARVVLAGYQWANIIMDFCLLAVFLVLLLLDDTIRKVLNPRRSIAREQLAAMSSQSYEDYRHLCQEVDAEEGTLQWRNEERDMPQAVLLRRTIDELDEAVKSKDMQHLKFLLSGLFRRNHLGIDNPSLHQHCLSGTKHLINRYQAKIRECLHAVACSPDLPPAEKETFFKQARRSLGRTAVCLSGGGSITLYHLGVVRALIEVGIFKYIRVVTGASGGSILAAMIAMKTEQELMQEVLTDSFVSDFKGGGRMAAEGIKWFFQLKAFPLLRTFFGQGLLSRADFEKTCAFYFGDVTFAEAYERTGRHVTITVSSSAVSGIDGAEELLLNHVTTPSVLIRSAVMASCSLPAILRPSKLLAKKANGEIAPFYLGGVEWIDGSVQADIPFRGVATMFSVSNSIVSQVNPHIVPFLPREYTKRLKEKWWKDLFMVVAVDISNRANSLQGLGLFPRFYGQNISTVFKQTYSAVNGVTIVPPFRLLDYLGTNMILYPRRRSMKWYISNGRRSCWRHLLHISHLMEVEVEIQRCAYWVMHGGLTEGVSAHLLHGPLSSPTCPLSAFYTPSSHSHRLSISGYATDDDRSGAHITVKEEAEEGPEREDGNDDDDDDNSLVRLELQEDDDTDLVNREFTFVSQKPDGGDAAQRRASTPPRTGPARELLWGLMNRLQWLEAENRKLSDQLSSFVGGMEHLRLFHDAKMRAGGEYGLGALSTSVGSLGDTMFSTRRSSEQGMRKRQMARRHSTS